MQKKKILLVFDYIVWKKKTLYESEVNEISF